MCIRDRVGTELWMAPELLNPQTARYTTKSDIYSFAIILVEIAKREYPYVSARNSFVLIKSWKENGQEEALPTDTPAAFVQLIERCRSLQPDHRPEAAEVIAYLDNIPEDKKEASDSFASSSPGSMHNSYAGNMDSQASAGFGSLEPNSSVPELGSQFGSLSLGSRPPAAAPYAPGNSAAASRYSQFRPAPSSQPGFGSISIPGSNAAKASSPFFGGSNPPSANQAKPGFRPAPGTSTPQPGFNKPGSGGRY